LALLGFILAGLYLIKISNVIFGVIIGLYVAYQLGAEAYRAGDNDHACFLH
jgi:hypothetical protein